MRSNLTKGIICIKDNYNIEYRVSIIEYEEFEDETYEYRFYPNYEIIGLLNDDIFQGIPGLNLDLRNFFEFDKPLFKDYAKTSP